MQEHGTTGCKRTVPLFSGVLNLVVHTEPAPFVQGYVAQHDTPPTNETSQQLFGFFKRQVKRLVHARVFVLEQQTRQGALLFQVCKQATEALQSFGRPTLTQLQPWAPIGISSIPITFVQFERARVCAQDVAWEPVPMCLSQLVHDVHVHVQGPPCLVRQDPPCLAAKCLIRRHPAAEQDGGSSCYDGATLNRNGYGRTRGCKRPNSSHLRHSFRFRVSWGFSWYCRVGREHDDNEKSDDGLLPWVCSTCGPRERLVLHSIAKPSPVHSNAHFTHPIPPFPVRNLQL